MKLTINNLMTQLHDTFGDDEPSPQVAQLMQEMQRHVKHWETPAPEEALLDTAEALATELEVEHPAAATVVRRIIEALNNMGV
jgi:hypothetical protein